MPNLTRKVEIRNKLGLHARAATKLARLASEFDAKVIIAQDGKEVDAGSVMGLMLLASQQGKHIEVKATGKDAEAALEAITTLVQERFHEEE
ncbi:phosphotransferase system HPr (HPr) family protein [Idiomarina sp. A28L]|uniref:HPr family phosphocarrier protein n=1 Tax=Idiomarina sp. A28L TaxID=1036674 RepID=UPI0002138836|nr:HPr family phosphocarrier protein [Idiomarina sp. A28L]EGN74883.1 phosphotransferase system HPr (HPr) family protein [Idiomarina sp. A28L]